MGNKTKTSYICRNGIWATEQRPNIYLGMAYGQQNKDLIYT